VSFTEAATNSIDVSRLLTKFDFYAQIEYIEMF